MSTPFFDPYEPIKKPMEFDTGDPTLRDDTSAHETAAVLRLQRAGWPGPVIMRTLGVSLAYVMNNIAIASSDEAEAKRLGRPVHCATVPKGTT